MTTITVASWNMNGIRAVIKKEKLDTAIAALDADIIGIQETKAQPDQVELTVPGYELLWNSAERKGYSGTAILTRSKPIRTSAGFTEEINKKFALKDTYGDTTTEGRVFHAEYEAFHFVTVYTPNAKDDLTRVPMREQWDPAFLAYMQYLEKTKPVVFCGDLNVAYTEDDLARPKPNTGKKGFTAEERSGFQAFVDAGFVDTFRMFTQGNGHYTWWSNWGGARERNVGWRIDYVMVSKSLKSSVQSAAIHADIMGSDHCPVSAKLELS